MENELIERLKAAVSAVSHARIFVANEASDKCVMYEELAGIQEKLEGFIDALK